MRRSQAGQATIEWSALLLALAFALAALTRRGRENGRVGLRGAHRARADVRGRTVAATSEIRSTSPTATSSPTPCGATRPNVVYERSSAALPIDFRRCRETDCSDGPDAARAIDRSRSGLPVTAFTRVVDRRARRRRPLPPVLVLLPGELHRRHRPHLRRRRGRASIRTTGRATRCGSRPAARVTARATAHGEYASGWSTSAGWYRVSGGSHAGQLVEAPRGERVTPRVEARRSCRSSASTSTGPLLVRGHAAVAEGGLHAPESASS